ncbi:hypothetical protein PoB_005340200 [Plakobranchus ocellatus]|uniref:Transmembrane protein n=1 Tax=Plakobranchus ocellatus TaxID=259542 RepID=A0AAV4C6L0_9GAST|nr:hypothetical protein PoB_005340200 [Plakobranchus ocellatus]
MVVLMLVFVVSLVLIATEKAETVRLQWSSLLFRFDRGGFGAVYSGNGCEGGDVLLIFTVKLVTIVVEMMVLTVVSKTLVVLVMVVTVKIAMVEVVVLVINISEWALW